MGDELVTVSNWLVSLDEPYLAKVQYEFFLPETEEERYKTQIINVSTKEDAWKIIGDSFIRLYINKTWVGNPDNQVLIDGESLGKFDFQFLDAIRDVERDMFSGKNTLLKNVIDFFIKVIMGLFIMVTILNPIKNLQKNSNLNKLQIEKKDLNHHPKY